MHKIASISKDSRKKPNTIVFYDKTKGGVDIVDYRIGKFTVKVKSARWTLNNFAFILDTSIVNASTIFKDLFPNQTLSTRDFIWSLGKALILPQLHRRRAAPGIGSKVRQNIAKFVPLAAQNDPADQAKSSRQRCASCIKSIVGDPNYKEKRERLPKNTRKCQLCSSAVCKKHTLVVCDICGSGDLGSDSDSA
eukprot:Seg801.4 transcript_id=Seg801.4/GoldUCD/mRNA.D3Y31 product="hypothetical protein" protein_id=Seg801.4/GoldUCD/D3Y31